jgi:hypothetical protein
MFLVTTLRAGTQWDATRPLEEQSGWAEHAEYMDALVAQGFIVLGGPLDDGHRVVLCVSANSATEVGERLSLDPWSGTHLILATIEPWTIRLDARRA